MTNPRTKPRLRGVSHQAAFFVALLASTLLVASAPSGRATAAAIVYGLSLAAMFGMSALYHRPMWSPVALRRLRRMDHATIFFFIAGTYTPLCMLALGESGKTLLVIVWIGAGLGVVRALAWVRPPRWLSAALYLLLGWLAITATPDLYAAIGATGIALLAAGGLIYTTGAVIYALRRPDPIPAVFGYHEIFHLLVIAASVCHFVLIVRVVSTAG